MAYKLKIEYEAPAWSQIYDMLLHQAHQIQADGYKPDIIISVARGGVVPARILSDLLETKTLVFIQVEYYESISQKKQKPKLKQSLTIQLTDKNALLVDDISDSGTSLQLAKKHLKQHCVEETKIATLYTKTASITKPDYYEKETDKWIVFPWDAKETVRKIIQKNKEKLSTKKDLTEFVKAGLPKQLVEEFLKEIQQEIENDAVSKGI
jgi:hypothetical protein